MIYGPEVESFFFFAWQLRFANVPIRQLYGSVEDGRRSDWALYKEALRPKKKKIPLRLECLEI